MIWLYWKNLKFLDFPNIQVDFLKINWIPVRMYITKLKEDWTEWITIENQSFFNFYEKSTREKYLEILESEITDLIEVFWFIKDIQHFSL